MNYFFILSLRWPHCKKLSKVKLGQVCYLFTFDDIKVYQHNSTQVSTREVNIHVLALIGSI